MTHIRLDHSNTEQAGDVSKKRYVLWTLRYLVSMLNFLGEIDANGVSATATKTKILSGCEEECSCNFFSFFCLRGIVHFFESSNWLVYLTSLTQKYLNTNTIIFNGFLMYHLLGERCCAC